MRPDISDHEVAAIIRQLSALQYAGAWDTLDTMFETADVKTMPTVHLIALVRMTFVAAVHQGHFRHWHGLVRRIRDEFNADGSAHGDRMMRGLWNTP
jgi:hypothetical protein